MDNHVLITDYLWFQEGPGVRNTQYTTDGVKLLNVANFVDGNIDLTTSSRYISDEEAYGKYKHFLVDEGDFLIASSGIQVDYFEKKMGFIRPEQLPLCMNTSTIRFKNLKPDELDMRYFMYYLKSNAFKNQLAKYIVGSAQLNFGPSHLKKMTFPVVEIKRQKYIVENLEKIYTLIALRKEQLAKLDELVKARFVELFGDVSDFVNITDIAHTYIGLVTTMTKHYCNNGTPLLFNSSIKSDKIVWDGTYLDMEFAEANKSRMHKTNDIVTVHTGDIGTSAVVGEEFNNSLGFATIVTRINDISRYYPRFVSSFLNYGSGKEQLKKYSRDVRNNLNLKDFNRLMVPNVSVLEQKRYVDFLEQTDKSKSAIQQSLDKLETLKRALMQKYFG